MALLLSSLLFGGVTEAAAPELPIRGIESVDLSASAAWSRHQRVARGGTRLVLTGGLIAVAAPLVALVPCARGTSLCAPLAVGAVLAEGVAVVTVVSGEAMMFGGGIATAYDAQKLGYDTTPTLGWIGLGLFTAGTAATLYAVADQDFEYGAYVAIGGVGGIVSGTILGYLQVANNGNRGLSVSVLPRPNGFALVGRF